MESLIIPGVLLVMLAMWCVIEGGRKFRNEFKKRGKGWEEVCAAMESGEGLLVVDMIWGPQKGLGRPVIWWLPGEMAEGAEVGMRVEEGDARLVKCPRGMKSVEALRGKFGERNVVVHSWAVAQEVMEAGVGAGR